MLQKLVLLILTSLIIFTGCTHSHNHSKRFSEEMGITMKRFYPEIKIEKQPVINENSKLSDYLAYAALNNPGVKAAFHQWQAAIQRIAQENALPDPMIEYEYQLAAPTDEQEHEVIISQTLPWFGKLRLKGEIAFQQAEEQRYAFEAARYKLFYEVRKAYGEYYYLAQSITEAEESLELLKYIEETARARLQFAQTMAKDVVQIQMELAKLDDRLKELRQMREPLMAKLVEVLNLPHETFLPFPSSIPLQTVSVNEADLVEILQQKNPELKELAVKTKEAQQAVELAKKNFYPDITLGTEYTNIDDHSAEDIDRNEISGIMSFNLPFVQYKKYHAGQKEAEEKLAASKYGYTSRQNSLIAELKRALFELKDAQRRMAFYQETLIPVAEHSLMMQQQAYQMGTGNIFEVIATQRSLLEFKLAMHRALTDIMIRQAELEMLLGAPLPG